MTISRSPTTSNHTQVRLAGDSSLASRAATCLVAAMSVSPTTPTYPALVIDGSSPPFFSGVLGSDGRWLASKKADAPALESLFETVDAVLESAELKLDEIRSLIYCEGPGSVLGLRLCAMAIETWRRIHPAPTGIYAYNSLRLVAACLVQEEGLQEEALLVSDWKKEAWNALKIRLDGPGKVTPAGTAELAEWQGPLYHLPARKGWQKPPANAVELAYEPERLAGLIEFPGLIEPRDCVELYNSNANSFQKWTAERHKAKPTAS